MDGRQFDDLSKTLARGATRRGVLKALAGGLVGGIGGLVSHAPVAGCTRIGKRCNAYDECCSGVCEFDKRGRGRCGACPDLACAPYEYQDPRDCQCRCSNGREICGVGQVCTRTDGCVAGCQPGSKLCGGVCLPEDACCDDDDCAAYQHCEHGNCVCDTGYHICDDTCASNADPATCGTSCSPCPEPAHSVATCDGTSCGLTCDSGTTWLADGCCVDANICGDACLTAPCDSADCQVCDPASGTCVTTCAGDQTCCGGTCKQANAARCTENAECCSRVCVDHICVSTCRDADETCDADNDCCSGLTCVSEEHVCCASGVACSAHCCASEHDVCDMNGECCSPDTDTTTCAGKCGEVINNCGQTGTCPGCPACQTCTDGHICSAVEDHTSCGANGICCDGSCVDDGECCVASDCPVGPHQSAQCLASTCQFTCDLGFADCNAVPGDGCETDILNDPDNCGACGVPCTTTDPNAIPVCNAGDCDITCAIGWTLIDGACCQNENVCGAAGSQQCCGSAESCIDGQCCPNSEICGTGDAQTCCDPATHVCSDGVCCPAGAINCGDGTCTAGTCCSDDECTDGKSCCDHTCVSLTTNENCGACGVPCSIANYTVRSVSCASGTCMIDQCTSPYGDCDGDPTNGCETYLYSNCDHCGSCNHTCSGDEDCSWDTIYCGANPECQDGTMCCQYSCVDLQSDPRNCGSCGQQCGAPENAVATCDEGVCGFTCDYGVRQDDRCVCTTDPEDSCPSPLSCNPDTGNCEAHNPGTCVAEETVCSTSAYCLCGTTVDGNLFCSSGGRCTFEDNPGGVCQNDLDCQGDGPGAACVVDIRCGSGRACVVPC